MNYSELHEEMRRGTFDFPIELYYVDEHCPQYQMTLHWHVEYELIIVLKGRFTLSLDAKTYELFEGDCAFISDGVVHGGTPHNCVYECVVFDENALLTDSKICKKSAKSFINSQNSFSNKFQKGTNEATICDKIFEAMEKEQRGYELTTVGLLWQFLGSILNKSNEKNIETASPRQIKNLKNVLTYIRNNYQYEMTLDEMAEVAGMSPKYFCRAFCTLTGKTPIEYLNYYRIENAGERLQLTDNSITDIALSCGFNDMSYFSKTFKKHKGVTPSQYKKM